MKYVLTALFIFVNVVLFAQHKRDTIYMNEDWEVTKSRDSAKYYRIIKEDKNLYFVTDYFLKSDSVQMTGAFKDYAQKTKEGEFIYYGKNGLITQRGSYLNGKKNGQHTSYYPTGELHYSEDYVNDEVEGNFMIYYQNGKIRRKETYKKGKLTFKACYLENGKKTKFFPYAVPAEPIGGMEAVKKYIVKNLHYPDQAVEDNIEGKVYVQFVISESGNISNVKVKKGAHPILDEEAIRIVKAMPAWKPGVIDGKNVKSTFSLPINFSLN